MLSEIKSQSGWRCPKCKTDRHLQSERKNKFEITDLFCAECGTIVYRGVKQRQLVPIGEKRLRTTGGTGYAYYRVMVGRLRLPSMEEDF